MIKLFTMMSVAAMSAMAMAQSVTTHSVYDVNQNGEINVADAVSVAQATLQEADPTQTQQYVTGEDLNTMFSTILTKLESLEARMTALENKKCDCGGSEGKPDENGIIANGHEYVDLGVVVDGKSVYWATTNIGAEQPADYGLYFAWGETIGFGSSPRGEKIVDEMGMVQIPVLDGRKFDWSSYSIDLCGGVNKMKKYCTSSNYGAIDNKIVLEPVDDAAHMNWQGTWRMPTKAEQDALRDQCVWIWTSMTNSEGKVINGYKISNKTDSNKFIFLPVAGGRDNGYLDSEGSRGNYWSASLRTDNCNYAYGLDFYSGNWDSGSHARFAGLSVRPVCQ